MAKWAWAVVVAAVMSLLIAIILYQYDALHASEQAVEESYTRNNELELSLARSQGAMLALEHALANSREIITALRPGRTLTVTAYSPTRDQCDDTPFVTASNNRVREGICAVSRDLYSKGWGFGKRVFVEGHGVFVIDDLMGQRAEQQIDIFMRDRDQALEFGRRQLEVMLLDA